MPMTIEHTQETLSEAYVLAVTGMAGASLQKPSRDYGVDGAIVNVDEQSGRHYQSPYQVDYQLKATKNWTLDPNTSEIVYDLEVKNYNDMVRRDTDDQSLYLFLLCLPQEISQWLDVSASQLALRKCCYWYKPVGPVSANSSTVRIRIPSSNILDPMAVQQLLSDEESRRRGLFR